MSPRGVPVFAYRQHYLQVDNGRIAVNEFTKRTSTDISSALDYIHGKGIAHNDVTPYNLVVTGEGEDLRVVLVDYSCACNFDQELCGFVGTPLYAHKAIFETYPRKKWSAKKEYDFSGLALTLCVLLEGKATWDVDGFPSSFPKDSNKKKELQQKFQQKMQARQAAAEAIISNHSSCKWKDQCSRWLAATDDTVSRKRKRRHRC